MKMNRQSQRQFRLQQVLFYLLLILFIGLLSNVAIKTDQQLDWTQNARHTLSPTTSDVLATLQQPVVIDVFVSPQYEYRQAVTDLLSRYQQHSAQLQVNYIDPAVAPDKVRFLSIQQQGEMVVSRGEQQQHVFDLSEQSLTNAIVSVSREKQQWLVFIEGHDERQLFEQNDASLSTWAKQLQSQGFKLHAQNLAKTPVLPDNTAAVVIASPLRDWLPGEITIIRDYIDNGGNVLWLADPDQTASLTALAEQLGIEFLPGTVMDSGAAALGIHDPRFILVQNYANHPIGVATSNVTLLADVVALQTTDSHNTSWTALNLLNSSDKSWVETAPLNQQNLSLQQFDAGADTAGPVGLGFALTRAFADDREQRIVVMGDSDFVTNAYIGTVANLDLAMATMNWLANDDALITIPVKTSVGTQLNFSRWQSMVIGFGFLMVLPALLLLIGFVIWWRRRRR